MFGVVFEVNAIITFDKEKSFVFCDRNRAKLCKARLFNILDYDTSANWIRLYYPKERLIENNKYDFNIGLKEFYGPKDMIEDENFFFDLIENDDKAFDFIQNIKE